MTKKTYIIVAAAIKEHGCNAVLLDALVAAFKKDNDRFDIDKFYEACGRYPNTTTEGDR